MPRRPVLPTVALAALLFLPAACASTSGAQESAESGLIASAADEADAARYAVAGPHDVGTVTRQQSDGRRVVVWYPTTEVDGGAPLVVFSHGYAGSPEQSETLVTQVASWGFVVAAPEHVERSRDGLSGGAADGIEPRSDVAVLQATIDLVADEAASGEGPLGQADVERLVVLGQAAGANAAYELASADDRVDGFVAYTPAFGGSYGAAPGRPEVPGMVMVADRDGAIDPRFAKQTYAAMASPKYLVKVYDAGHHVFTDDCLVDEAADASSASSEGSAPDGCQPELPPVAEAQPAIAHTTIAFLRSTLGIDAAPVGLDTEAVARLGTPVTVTHE